MKATAAAAAFAFAVLLSTGASAGAGTTPGWIGAATSNVQTLGTNQSADVYGVGGGKAFNFADTVSFSFSAHEGPNGDFGQVSVTYSTFLGNPVVSYSIKVTCVNIDRFDFLGPFNRGVIRGVITKITPNPNLLGLTTGDTVDFGIKDGGNPSSGPVDDFYAPSTEGPPTALGCKSSTYTGNLNNVTQGNVNIKGP
jgi:hypothetical protein